MHSGEWCIYVVPVGAQLPEGLDEEPGAFVPRPVQRDPHGVLLQQSREALVHRQVLVALHVEELQKQIRSCGDWPPDLVKALNSTSTHQLITWKKLTETLLAF